MIVLAMTRKRTSGNSIAERYGVWGSGNPGPGDKPVSYRLAVSYCSNVVADGKRLVIHRGPGVLVHCTGLAKQAKHNNCPARTE